MTLWLILLSIEDVLVIGAILLFLFGRQRPYIIVAGVLMALLLITNAVVILGYHNWLVLAIPIIALYALGLFGRQFLPRPLININSKTSQLLLGVGAIALLVPILLLLVLLIHK